MHLFTVLTLLPTCTVDSGSKCHLLNLLTFSSGNCLNTTICNVDGSTWNLPKFTNLNSVNSLDFNLSPAVWIVDGSKCHLVNFHSAPNWVERLEMCNKL